MSFRRLPRHEEVRTLRYTFRTFLERLARTLGREDALGFGSGVGVVMLVTVFILVATASPIQVRASRRVVATPTRLLAQPVVESKARPPVSGPAVTATPECPQLDNPGGLRWRPRPDAGPWPTSGFVQLPRFDVTAPIVKVGVNTAAEMVVPRNARDVAWLDQGPYPGDTNNVVLAGHIKYSGVLGSFGRLQQVNPGDRIVVVMDGKRHEYVVKWTCLFDYNTTLAERIMGYTEVPSATLISCGGVFQRSAGTHNKRVAVRAELVGSTEV